MQRMKLMTQNLNKKYAPETIEIFLSLLTIHILNAGFLLLIINNIEYILTVKK